MQEHYHLLANSNRPTGRINHIKLSFFLQRSNEFKPNMTQKTTYTHTTEFYLRWGNSRQTLFLAVYHLFIFGDPYIFGYANLIADHELFDV